METFAFRFDPRYRVVAAPFGITPATTAVVVAGGRLSVRFGPWVVATGIDNIVGTEVTGPFSIVKAGGPARLSLADRGLTMATNGDSGLCLRFAHPIKGIDPLGVMRHPGLTLTVDDVDGLRAVLERSAGDHDAAEAAAVGDDPGESPWRILARWARWPPGMALATVRYLRSRSDVVTESEVRPGPPPAIEPADVPGVQSLADGVGPAYERTYRIPFSSPLTPEEVLERVAADLNDVSPREVADFVPSPPAPDPGATGAEYRVRMPGPWKAPVVCVDRTPTSFRLATRRGHMEAGQIEFRVSRGDGGSPDRGRAEDSDPPLVFQIRSVARSSGRAFALLYGPFSLGSEMQSHMWAHVCRRAVAKAGGEALGPVEVKTVRYAG